MQQAGEDSRRENARPEMKKRKISGFYAGLFLLTSVFSLAMIAFDVWFLIVYMQENIASLRGLSLVGLMLFLRQIPQTTVAARRVLRYNQTNLCLSA